MQIQGCVQCCNVHSVHFQTYNHETGYSRRAIPIPAVRKKSEEWGEHRRKRSKDQENLQHLMRCFSEFLVWEDDRSPVWHHQDPKLTYISKKVKKGEKGRSHFSRNKNKQGRRKPQQKTKKPRFSSSLMVSVFLPFFSEMWQQMSITTDRNPNGQ